ncbi:hypothetical protein C8A03DRAFT_42977 [Achaetomium macrosporum]|uniref:Uncharacterized protein n=1 Tax=Achaetomium macrosporum TaxID=79813 RepID=A0AAN7CC97_9PEZI|nr:hypothetical protein C8A03DRAFT_42977 [Achaetomium macrosporum]
MHDNKTHPLLQQVPLTVSPFIQLPSATTLPYQYKQMPSTLPPSAAGIIATSATDDPTKNNNPSTPVNKPKYVVSASGHAAHPDDILASCRALHAHVAQLQAQSEKALRELDERIKARELAEKRRVAPGWLDSEARLLEPERKSAGTGAEAGAGQLPAGNQERGLYESGTETGNGYVEGGPSEMAVPDEGAELDRAFGSMQLGKP